jgi:pimeloyl-ACP methyl ester carboxylesterase
MKHLGVTPPFRASNGQILPRSIAENAYLRLGGIDQWVMIRGENVRSPALILLHGGPGFSEMRLFRTYNADLEKKFTVVYWEQRGTGKSFDRKTPVSSMTVAQFVADLDALVEVVRQRFDKQKVTIYGHSWGSVLGVLYAVQFPEKVAAYVGTGQIGDWPTFELLSYQFTLAEATRRGNRSALAQLRAIGPPPHDYWTMTVQRKWLTRFVGVARDMSTWHFIRIALGGPEASILDLPNLLRGVVFSRCMWPEISVINLMHRVPSLQMPVFFFIGRQDHVVAAETSVAYFDMLSAPSKKFVWFEASGHEPPVDEAAKFNATMTDLVRPVVA